MTLIQCPTVRLPFADRVPPVTFRYTAIGRMSRSDPLLSPGIAGLNRNAMIPSQCCSILAQIRSTSSGSDSGRARISPDPLAVHALGEGLSASSDAEESQDDESDPPDLNAYA